MNQRADSRKKNLATLMAKSLITVRLGFCVTPRGCGREVQIPDIFGTADRPFSRPTNGIPAMQPFRASGTAPFAACGQDPGAR